MAYTIMIEDETQATGWSDRFEGSEHNQFWTRHTAETAVANLSVVYPSVRWAVFQNDDIEPVYIYPSPREDTMAHVTQKHDESILGQHVSTILADDSIDWTGYWPVVDPDDLTVTAISDGDDDHLVLADIVDGRVVIRDGASDVMIRKGWDISANADIIESLREGTIVAHTIRVTITDGDTVVSRDVEGWTIDATWETSDDSGSPWVDRRHRRLGSGIPWPDGGDRIKIESADNREKTGAIGPADLPSWATALAVSEETAYDVREDLLDLISEAIENVTSAPYVAPDADLVLVRSDTGDGGWSLHPAGSTDEQIASGDAPYLVSGSAQWVDGEWDRPNAEDYAQAHAQA